MARAQEFDVVVVGGGPVGENVVDRTARAGLTTALIESELVGGECSYWACIPSKTLLRPGALLAEARGVPGVREILTGTPDPGATFARRDYEVGDWSDAGQAEWLESVGVTLLRGSARFVGPRRLRVGSDGAAPVDVSARRAVVVATGSEPVIPPIPGLALARPWTSREATSADAVPRSLAVLGGGVVGVELALAFADLGSEVTLVVRGGRVLPRAEPFASDQVLDGLRRAGVTVLLEAAATRAHRDGAGPVDLEVTVDDETQTLRAEQLLVATGRRPRTDDLGLDVLGLDARGLVPGAPIAVDDALTATAVEDGWLFAAGDVTGRTGTTHQGKYDARIVGEVIVSRFSPDAGPDSGPDAGPHAGAESPRPWSAHRATADLVGPPQVVFGRPEVAQVGLTLADARSEGRPVRALDHDLARVSGAYLKADDYAGTARLVVDTERELVVGATFTGPDAAELLHAATVAVVGEVPLRRLWHAVPAFPTVSEVWLRLLEGYGL